MEFTHEICINGRFLTQQATGVQKYALGICRALQKVHPRVRILVPRGKFGAAGLSIHKTGFLRGTLWEQLYLPLYMLLRPGAHLVNLCNAAPFVLRRQTVTIHDLAYLHSRKWFRPAFRRWYSFLVPQILRRSFKVICVSETIRDELCSVFPFVRNKTAVIFNGLPPLEPDMQSPLAFRYLLLTGIGNPRKNAGFVLQNIQTISAMGLKVVAIFGAGEIFIRNQLPQHPALHIIPYAGEKEYATLIYHAAAMVYPSEYEGFGIPVLEALSLGVPVVAPRIRVYTECFGEAPVYYRAGDADGFCKAVFHAVSSKPRADLTLDLKNKYTFERSAASLAELLLRVHNSK